MVHLSEGFFFFPKRDSGFFIKPKLMKATMVHLSEGLVFLTLTDSRKLFDQPSTHEGHNDS